MRLGQVIGKVTLSQQDPAYKGGRFLMVSPLDKGQIAGKPLAPLSSLSSLVVYDNLGAGDGVTIGYIEGGEAMQSFEQPTPVDAFNCAIIDLVEYQPPTDFIKKSG